MKSLWKCFYSIILLLVAAPAVFAQTTSYSSLNIEIQSIQKKMVPDTRVAILDIEIRDTLLPVCTVHGQTDLPEAKPQILELLKAQNIAYVDSIRLLPETFLGDSIWALGALSVSNLRSKPDDSAELVSQITMGTPLKVLDKLNKWYRVQTPEKYIGWMDYSGLQRLSSRDVLEWKNSNRHLFKSVSGVAYDVPDMKGGVVSDLVMGDLFVVKETKQRYYKIQLPDGRVGYVRKADCISFNDWSNLKLVDQNILWQAKQMMGYPYLWGGTSSKGVDCSGFTKIVFYSQGIILARDASQQARYGQVIDVVDRNNLLPGDLLFFGRTPQRITHVGIYLGNGDFIHASGKVHISSINPDDPKFVVTRNLVAARRIINLINTEGIVRVKDHPWYN